LERHLPMTLNPDGGFGFAGVCVRPCFGESGDRRVFGFAGVRVWLRFGESGDRRVFGFAGFACGHALVIQVMSLRLILEGLQRSAPSPACGRGLG
jgi:hypothetical protein